MAQEEERLAAWYWVLLGGAQDAVRANATLYCYRNSEKVRNRVHDSVLLNLILFVGSLLLYHQLLQPLSNAVLGAVLSNSELAANTTWLVDGLISAFYYLCWVWPVYAVSLLLNGLWYQEIAQAAVYERLDEAGRQRLRHRGGGISAVDQLAADCYRLLLGFVYLAQTAVLSGLPLVGRPVAVVSVAWLYAFYSFEYTWAIVGWPLRRRMQYFAQRYIYFVGYGLPFSLVLFSVPGLIRDGLFAALFPWFIINALFASAPKRAAPCRLLPDTFQPFHWSYGWTSILLRHVARPAYGALGVCRRSLGAAVRLLGRK